MNSRFSKRIEPTDDELMAQIALRSRLDAFEDLLHRYEKAALRLARHITGNVEAAEEAVQEAMLRVWLFAATYRPGEVRTWLLSIVARECFKKKRCDRRLKGRLQGVAAAPEASLGLDPESGLLHAEALEAVRKSFGELPVSRQRMMWLYFCEGYSQQQLGKMLKISSRTVSYLIHEMLEHVRRQLARDQGMAVEYQGFTS